MITLKKSEPKYTIPQLIAELFESRTVAHKQHLATNSYAFHKATDDYYSSVVDLVDGIVESYQGQKGIQIIPDPKLKNNNFVEYLQQLYDLCTATQSNCEYSDIVNDIDGIKSLINKTLYKIKILK